MRHRTGWQALGQNPLKVLGSSWPWRSLAYLTTGVACGAVTVSALLVLLVAGVVSLVVLIGAPILLTVALSGVLTRFGHEVLAAVGDADTLATAVREHAPDIVVTDVRMPPDNTDDGLRAAVALRREHPGLPVPGPQPVHRAVLRRPAARPGQRQGRRLPAEGPRQRGERVRRRGHAGRGGRDGRRPGGRTPLLNRRRDPLQRLTPREREVLALMAEGRSSASPPTVPAYAGA
nr:hypothetical protein [Actinospica acidiphila]